MPWEDILKDPQWKELPLGTKNEVARIYFDKNIATDEYKALDKGTRQEVATAFFSTINEPKEFKTTNPNLYAAGMTVAGLPGTVVDTAREAFSGATLGISDKILPKPSSKREVIKGEEFIAPKDLDSTSAKMGLGAAKMAGEFLPISKAAKVIGSGAKIVTNLTKSKWADPLAKITGWGIAGGAKTAAEHLIKEGELPTVEDVAKDAGIWAGIEAATTSVGWAGRVALGVNKLAKVMGTTKTEALQHVLRLERDKGTTGLVPILNDVTALKTKLKEMAEGGASNEAMAPVEELIKKQSEEASRKLTLELMFARRKVETDRLGRDLEENIIRLREEYKNAKDAARKAEIRQRVLPNAYRELEANNKSGLLIGEKLRQLNIKEYTSEEAATLLDPIKYGVTETEDQLVRKALQEELAVEFSGSVRSARSEEALRMKAILDRPSFTWDAMDKLAVQKFVQEGENVNLPKPTPVAPAIKATVPKKVSPAPSKTTTGTPGATAKEAGGTSIPEPVPASPKEVVLSGMPKTVGGLKAEMDGLVQQGKDLREQLMTAMQSGNKPLIEELQGKIETILDQHAKVASEWNVARSQPSAPAARVAPKIETPTPVKTAKETKVAEVDNSTKLAELEAEAGRVNETRLAALKANNKEEATQANKLLNFVMAQIESLKKSGAKVAQAAKSSTPKVILRKKGNKVEASDGVKTETMSPEDIQQLKDMGLWPPKQNVFGAVAGIDIDEEGTISYDPMKGAVGMAAGMVFFPRPKKAITFVPKTLEEQNALQVADMFRKTDDALISKFGMSAKKFKDAFVRGFIDVSGKAKNMLMAADPELGRQAVIMRNLTAGSNAEAVRQFGFATEKIHKGLNGRMKTVLDNLIAAQRNVEIAGYKPGVRHPDALQGKQFQDYLDNVGKIEGLTTEQVTNLETRMGEYFKATRNQLDQLLSNGIVSQEAFDAMKDKLYSPRKYLEYLDTMDGQISGRAINAPNSGIKALDEGSIGLMEKRSQLLLQQHTSRVQDLIARNKANLSVLELADELAKQNVTNPLVRRANIIGYSKNGVPQYAQPKSGEGIVSVMENGTRVDMIVPKEFEKSWVKTDPLINHTLSKFLGWFSLSTPLKAAATGYNPLFWITNMPRDIALVWSGHQYSGHLPVAIAQFAKDFAVTAKDVFTRKGAVQDYIRDGGGTEFLTYYGRFGGHGAVGEQINSVTKVLGYLGETSEIWTRVAHRRRALENLTTESTKRLGRAPNAQEMRKLEYEATNIAREGSIDFSQGGNVIKFLDTMVPYLNASIQGTRVLGRNAKQDPINFAYKMAQLSTASLLLYAWNRSQNPEALKQISDSDKAQNFIIVPPQMPGVTDFHDSQGNKVYRFMKIAKDQPQQIFLSAMDAAAEFGISGTIPKRQLFIALQNLGIKTSLPPLLAGAIAMAANVNDFTWDQIWKGAQGVDPKEEAYPETPKAFKELGQATGLSPVRMQTALGKVLPYSNPIVSATGTAIQFATGEAQEKLATTGWNELVSANPSVKRLMSYTNPATEYREESKEIDMKVRTERFVENRDFDEKMNRFFKTKSRSDYDAVVKYIQSAPEEIQDRLTKRYEDEYEIKDLPDKYFWKNLRKDSPKARAEKLWNRLKTASPEKKAEMLQKANSISGIATEDMIREFNKVARQ